MKISTIKLLPASASGPEDLQYAGLDYYVNGSVSGHYYYTLVDGFCQFYLLDAKNGELPAPSIESLDIHGRLIELKASEYQALLETMASALGWKASSLEEVTSVYAVSALPSAFYLNFIGRMAANLCLACGLAELFWSLFCLAFPLASPGVPVHGRQRGGLPGSPTDGGGSLLRQQSQAGRKTASVLLPASVSRRSRNAPDSHRSDCLDGCQEIPLRRFLLRGGLRRKALSLFLSLL